MPLVVRPNPRRMRAFIESPAERPDTLPRRRGIVWRVRWERLFLAAGAIAAIAVALAILTSH
jgi:ABC-type Fe3+-siderophore transport system permease subunit